MSFVHGEGIFYDLEKDVELKPHPILEGHKGLYAGRDYFEGEIIWQDKKIYEDYSLLHIDDIMKDEKLKKELHFAYQVKKEYFLFPKNISELKIDEFAANYYNHSYF
jgi:hypothetical protein